MKKVESLVEEVKKIEDDTKTIIVEEDKEIAAVFTKLTEDVTEVVEEAVEIVGEVKEVIAGPTPDHVISIHCWEEVEGACNEGEVSV